jgi:hypothetical protein
MENRLMWSFCANVLLSSLIKKPYLLMRSSDVRELMEELRLLSDILNYFGRIAHSLLFRRVFICDCRDRRCRKSLVSAFLRFHFY